MACKLTLLWNGGTVHTLSLTTSNTNQALFTDTTKPHVLEVSLGESKKRFTFKVPVCLLTAAGGAL